MEKKSSTTQNRRRKKEKEVSDSVLEKSSLEEHDGGSTPLASSTPATKRRGRPPQSTTTSPNTPQTKSYPKRKRTPVKFEDNIENEQDSSLALDGSQTLSITSEFSPIDKEESKDRDEEQSQFIKKVGRKRGRSSKNLQDSVEEIPLTKRRRGPAKGSKPVDRLESGVTKDNKQDKRGRHQAKKRDEGLEESSDEDDDTGGNQTNTGAQGETTQSAETTGSNNRRGAGRRKASLQKPEQPKTLSSEDKSTEDKSTEDSGTEGTPVQKKFRKGGKSKNTEQDVESEISCLRCQEKFSNISALKNHLMRKHTALYSADCPEGKEDRASVRQIFKIRSVLHCPKCDKELRNVQYYFKHLEWCGRESEVFTCTVCQRVYKKMYEIEHYRNHKLQERKEKELEEIRMLKKKEQKEIEKQGIKLEINKQGRHVRKAAKRAVNVLKDISRSGDAFAEGGDDDDDPDLQLDIEEEEDDFEEDLDEDASDESEIRNSEKTNSEKNLDSDLDELSDEEGRRRRKTGLATGRKTQGMDVYRDVYVHCLDKNLKRCQLVDGLPDVYPELKPKKSQWKLQDPQEAEEFLPVTQESLKFQIMLPGKNVNPPVQRLRRFQAEFIKETHNCFVGGPVWGLAWCPMPHNIISDQFLAISCHREMDEKHETKVLYTGNGSIQLWNVGKLNSISPDESMKSSPPFIEFCLSHGFGVIYQLCWCPSNAWEKCQKEDSESPELLPRLGLLAGAFSDGNVHIFSVPHPESLNLDIKTDVPQRSFKPCPVVSLVPFSTSRQDKKFPCLCVDWQPKACQFMAAGYGDGTIRVWDLTSQSSLLRLVTSPTIVLLPFHISTAHNDSVMCIQWSPHVTDKFASSSRDRSFAMWNLKNRHFPMYKSPSQMSLSLYWLPFNFCVLQGMDDCYTHLEAYVRAESYDHLVGDDSTVSDPVVPISDCIWGLTCSDYLMVVLTSNNAGIVSGCIMPHLKRKDVKRFHRRPVVVYETAVQEKRIDNEADGSTVPGKKKSKADPSVFTSYESGKDSVIWNTENMIHLRPKGSYLCCLCQLMMSEVFLTGQSTGQKFVRTSKAVCGWPLGDRLG
uniref:Uncharacterized protein LOC111126165 n=1 Tax=Crassostrea virginica TaxID=6565 RepID=A0A8B8DF52_CRAVI|nr:uncharacterized protein LOC111126165 [Crassostrea virginica]XP_022326325.1 uncharacterized protein LOC111126165 [Crassostrea virginica]XP_022326335.1 uncharacterized protein LOC111126165 [Crassostrea virginica]